MGLQRFFAESTKQKNGDNFDINMKIKDCFYNVFSSKRLSIFCYGLAMLPYFILLAGYIPGIMFRLRCGVLRQKQQDTPPCHVLSKRIVLYPLQYGGHLLWGTRTHRKISEEKL